MIVRRQSQRRTGKFWLARGTLVLFLMVLLLVPMRVEAAPVGSASNPLRIGNKSLKEYFYDTYFPSGTSAIKARKDLLKQYPAEKNGRTMTYYVRVGNTNKTGLCIDDQEDDDLYVFWCSALDRSPGSSGTGRDYPSNSSNYGKFYTKGGGGTYYNTFGYGIRPDELNRSWEQDKAAKLYRNNKLILWIADSSFSKRRDYYDGPTAASMKNQRVGSFWFATESGARAKNGACAVYYAKYSTLYNMIKSNKKLFQEHEANTSAGLDHTYYVLYVNGMPSLHKGGKWGNILDTQSKINSTFKSAFGSKKDYTKQNLNHKVYFEVADALTMKVRIWDNYKGKVAKVYKKGSSTREIGAVNLTEKYNLTWNSVKPDHQLDIQNAILAALKEYGCVTDASSNGDAKKRLKYSTVKNYNGKYNQASLFFLTDDYNVPTGQRDQYDAFVPIGVRVTIGDPKALKGTDVITSNTKYSTITLDDRENQSLLSTKDHGWLNFDPRQTSTDRDNVEYKATEKMKAVVKGKNHAYCKTTTKVRDGKEYAVTDFLTDYMLSKADASAAHEELQEYAKKLGKSKQLPNHEGIIKKTTNSDSDLDWWECLTAGNKNKYKIAKDKNLIVYVDIICDRINHYEVLPSFYALECRGYAHEGRSQQIWGFSDWNKDLDPVWVHKATDYDAAFTNTYSIKATTDSKAKTNVPYQFRPGSSLDNPNFGSTKTKVQVTQDDMASRYDQETGERWVLAAISKYDRTYNPDSSVALNTEPSTESSTEGEGTIEIDTEEGDTSVSDVEEEINLDANMPFHSDAPFTSLSTGLANYGTKQWKIWVDKALEDPIKLRDLSRAWTVDFFYVVRPPLIVLSYYTNGKGQVELIGCSAESAVQTKAGAESICDETIVCGELEAGTVKPLTEEYYETNQAYIKQYEDGSKPDKKGHEGFYDPGSSISVGVRGNLNHIQEEVVYTNYVWKDHSGSFGTHGSKATLPKKKFKKCDEVVCATCTQEARDAVAASGGDPDSVADIKHVHVKWTDENGAEHDDKCTTHGIHYHITSKIKAIRHYGTVFGKDGEDEFSVNSKGAMVVKGKCLSYDGVASILAPYESPTMSTADFCLDALSQRWSDGNKKYKTGVAGSASTVSRGGVEFEWYPHDFVDIPESDKTDAQGKPEKDGSMYHSEPYKVQYGDKLVLGVSTVQPPNNRIAMSTANVMGSIDYDGVEVNYDEFGDYDYHVCQDFDYYVPRSETMPDWKFSFSKSSTMQYVVLFYGGGFGQPFDKTDTHLNKYEYGYNVVHLQENADGTYTTTQQNPVMFGSKKAFLKKKIPITVPPGAKFAYKYFGSDYGAYDIPDIWQELPSGLIYKQPSEYSMPVNGKRKNLCLFVITPYQPVTTDPNLLTVLFYRRDIAKTTYAGGVSIEGEDSVYKFSRYYQISTSDSQVYKPECLQQYYKDTEASGENTALLKLVKFGEIESTEQMYVYDVDSDGDGEYEHFSNTEGEGVIWPGKLDANSKQPVDVSTSGSFSVPSSWYNGPNESYAATRKGNIVYVLIDAEPVEQSPDPNISLIVERIEEITPIDPPPIDWEIDSAMRSCDRDISQATISDDDEGMYAYIRTGSLSEPIGYDALTNIPTSEYLKTYAGLLKYETRLKLEKHVVTWNYKLTMTKDEHSVSSEPGKVTRSTTYYTVAQADTYVPLDVTIFNDTLNGDTGMSYMKVNPDNAPWINPSLGFHITQGAIEHAPSYDIPDFPSKFTTMYPGRPGQYIYTSTDLTALLDSCVAHDQSSTNDLVTFCDGEGNYYELSTNHQLGTSVNDIIKQPPLADVCKIDGDSTDPYFRDDLLILSDRANDKHPSGWSSGLAELWAKYKFSNVDYGLWPEGGIPSQVTSLNANIDAKDDYQMSVPMDNNKDAGAIIHWVNYVNDWPLYETASDGTRTQTGETKTFTFSTARDRLGDQDTYMGIDADTVKIHTPVFAHHYIIADEDIVQTVYETAPTNLVLDTSFVVHTDCVGAINDDPGYGVQDYSKYLYEDVIEGKVQRAVQVRFPFPVIQKTIAYYENGNPKYVDRYYYSNTWIPIKVGNTTFTVPAWIDEVNFTEVEYRSIAENTQILDDFEIKNNRRYLKSYNYYIDYNDCGKVTPNYNGGNPDLPDDEAILQWNDAFRVFMYDDKSLNSNPPLYKMIYKDDPNSLENIVDSGTPRLYRYQDTMNAEENNYVAITNESVSVSGRVYGMKIIDITDYPSWENYFRNSDGTVAKNVFFSGLTNHAQYYQTNDTFATFPTVNGSNTMYRNTGIMNPGYAIKFTLETVGNMQSANDYVEIRPTFHWLDKNGNDKGEVSVYYANSNVNRKYENLIKVGSMQDKMNKKVLALGDFDLASDSNYGKLNGLQFKYNTGAKDQLNMAAQYHGMSLSDLLHKKTEVWNMSNIKLNQYLRTYDGIRHATYLDEGYTAEIYKSDDSSIIDPFTSLKASVIYAAKQTADGNPGSGFDQDAIYQSIQEWYGEYYLPSTIYVTDQSDSVVQSQCASDLTGLEDCWLSDGYLAVNFDVTTINGDVTYLSYNNKDWYVSSAIRVDGTQHVNTDIAPVEQLSQSEINNQIEKTIADTAYSEWLDMIYEISVDQGISENEATQQLISNLGKTESEWRAAREEELRNEGTIEEEVKEVLDTDYYNESTGANIPGTCDMWAREMYLTKKQDRLGLTFNLKEGDVILYEIKNKPGTNNSAGNDYTGAGTH